MGPYLTPSGSAIRNRRLLLGLEVKDVAAKIGVTGSILSRYETGVRSPSPTTLRLLAETLGCEIADLLHEAPPGVIPPLPRSRARSGAA